MRDKTMRNQCLRIVFEFAILSLHLLSHKSYSKTSVSHFTQCSLQINLILAKLVKKSKQQMSDSNTKKHDMTEKFKETYLHGPINILQFLTPARIQNLT